MNKFLFALYLWLYTIVPCTVYILHKLIWTRTWIDSWLFQILHFHFKPNIWWIFHGLIQQMDSLHFHWKTNIWWIFHGLIQRVDSLHFPFISNILWIFHRLIQHVDSLHFHCKTNIWWIFHGLIQQVDGFLTFSFRI